MSEPTGAKGAGGFRVGDWMVDPEGSALRRGDTVVTVEPRVMCLLAHLASRPGRVISRRELIDTVWDGVVVGENSIHRAVWALREALGDDPKHPRYVETIRKGGYRLIAPVGDGKAPTGRVRARRTRFLAPALLFALAAVVAAILFVRHDPKRSAPRGGVFLEGVPVTSYPGKELFPALSPEGRRVAFSRDDEDGNGYDLYVKDMDAPEPARLTGGPEDDAFPCWSPGGDSVLFVRAAEDSNRLLVIPARGGDPRVLHASASPLRDPDWSPDGERIAFSVWDAETHAYRLRVLTLDTGDLLEPVRPEPGASSDLFPEFSPDGGRLAFIRMNAIGFYRIRTAPVGGGEGRLVATGRRFPSGLAWMPGGDELLVTAAPVGPFTLWRVDARTGAMAGMAARNRRVWAPSVSDDGRVLLYATGEIRADVMRAPIADPAAQAVPLIRSTCLDSQPRHSPDGSKIAFISDRSGGPEVWVCDRNGEGAVRLTFFDGAYVFHPFWSPDGRWLAFSVGGPEGVDAYLVEAEGGKPRFLAGGPGNDAAVSWSRSGGWVYLASDRDGAWRLWKIRPDGSGARPVSDVWAIRGEESPEGAWLYTLSLPACEILRAPAGGGEPDTLVRAAGPPFFDASNWTVGGDWLYLLRGDGDETRFIRLDPETREETFLRPAPNVLNNSISISPDGSELLYARYEQREVDLMVVEDFR